MNGLDAASDVSLFGSGIYKGSELIELVHLVRILKRNKYSIAVVAALCMCAAIIYLLAATPIYQSDIEIVIEGNSGPLVSLDDKGNSKQDEKDINMDDAGKLLQSRKLAVRVINQLQLADDPEFQPRPLDKWLSGVLEYIFPLPPEPTVNPELHQKIAMDRLTQAFLDRLDVSRIDRSNVLLVSFSAKSAETAWKVATAIGENYLAWRTEQKSESAQKANAWLDERTRQLAERVRQADKAAEEYRSSHGLLEGERVALISEQISKVSASLVDGSAERKKTEADLAQVRRIVVAGGDVSSAPQILDSELYVRLRDQQLELEREYAQESRELGPRHPSLQQLQAKRKQTQKDIRDEVNKVALSLENRAAAARQQEAALTADLARLKQELAQANLHAVELHALEQEADTSREMLHKMVSDAIEKDAERSPGAQSPQASVVSEATFPDRPAKPKMVLILVLGACGGLLLGTLYAFLREMLDITYRSSPQVERTLALPVLSYVPRLRRRQLSTSPLQIAAPISSAAEAIRAIRTRLSSFDPTVKALAFASSEPEEGKSMLAIAMAAIEGRAGRRVLLIDADIRMSRVARNLRLVAHSGLVNVLLDAVPIGHVIHTGVLPGVDVVPARGNAVRDRYADAVTGRREAFVQALNRLRVHYDLILIDSPPVSVLTDAQVVAAIADVAVFVVAWGRTSQQSVQTAANTLRAAGAKLAGVVFNKVDDAAVTHYTEGEAGYCNRRYRRYYALRRENA